MMAGAAQRRCLAGFVRGAGSALILLLALSSARAEAPAAGLQPVPPLTARVTDLTGTLTVPQRTALEQKLAAFEAAKGSQLAVLIVPTTQPEEIEPYSIRVVEQWKLGRGEVGGKKVDDGALLLIVKNDHRIRIEVGYGLEGVLTDAISNRIISETIAPEFRRGDFYGGIDAGLGQMMRLIQGEPLPPPPHNEWQSSGHHGGGSNLLVLLFFAVLIGSSVLRAIFGRTIGSALTGGMAGVLVWVLVHVVYLAGLAAIAGFVLAMIAGVARGSGWSTYPRAGGFGGGWGGFGGGLGGGGFGGSGGGFSGGGGGFGGGGASGSW
jgi:uncharacterized protein